MTVGRYNNAGYPKRFGWWCFAKLRSEEFEDFLAYAISRGFRVNLYTNVHAGLTNRSGTWQVWNSEKHDAVTHHPYLTFLVNEFVEKRNEN